VKGVGFMNRKLRYAILGADLLWIGGAFVFADLLYSGASIGGARLAAQSVDSPAFLAALFVWIILYFSKKLEGFCRGWHLPSVFAQVTVGVCYLMGGLVLLARFAKYDYSQAELLCVGGLLPPGFIAIRCSVWRFVTLRTHRRSRRRVVILGAGRTARELAHKIAIHPEMSMEVAGVLFPSDGDVARQSATMAPNSISLRSLNILNLLQENNIQELIIVEPVPPGPETEKLISSCRRAGIRLHLVPQHYELYLSRAELNEIDDVPLLSLEERKFPVMGVRVKRCIDIIGALLLLALSAPLLGLASAALYGKKGKAFRKELRCGKNEAPFWMYRLNIDRDAKDLQGYARILVQLSLTELPQLWNVMKGEMSLVGPRPESRDRVRHYSAWQRQRLSIHPGLTGLAQVRGLREQHSSEEKARLDLQYIGQWSLFLDLSLLLQTAWALCGRLMKDDPFKIAPALPSKLAREFGVRRMMHADSAQSGAD
jgi:lipopolysaccharide/colanic/teichoic acid biosynthesis glycosyltransferase